MSMVAPQEGVSTRRSTGPRGQLIERTVDYVTAGKRLWDKIKIM